MPELPDVEVYKQYMDATSLHQKIESVDVTENRVLENISENTLKDLLKGNSFDSTHRHGKYLFAQLADYQSWLLLHFGMTGFLRYQKEDQENEGHTRVRFDFTNGYNLSYDNQRLLGRVGIVDSIDEFIESNSLGPDAYALSEDEFVDIIAHRRGMIKSTLMNQSILAGLGNVYVDEILYHAGIHPETKCPDLSDAEISTIYAKMHHVVDGAIDAKAQPEKMPAEFLLPHRNEEESCPKCSGKIKKMKVNGRATYICPKCQG